MQEQVTFSFKGARTIDPYTEAENTAFIIALFVATFVVIIGIFEFGRRNK
jgi:hypothetical protein